uniref:Putative amidase n=1 Tax=Corethrella appendiculata TaxID=1370023 RepID=U5ELF6_9DIPT
MHLILSVFGIFLRVVDFVLTPFLIIYCGTKRRKPFPQIRNEILLLSAVDLAERIRNKELRSEDVVRAYIDRIKEVNPLINAVVEERFSDAIQDARNADNLVNSMPTIALLKTYPLLGVPFTVKESCSLKGSLYTGGSLPRVGMRAAKDGDAVANLRGAGCIPLLVSNTPEFCMSWESYNHVTGRTLNPYDNRRTAGGSSGGEGALISSAGSIFGVGSDLAGSIRVPALFNGIFGHKPTGGVIPLNGHFPNCPDENFQQYLTIGPMCRYAKDLSTLMHVMSGSNASKLKLDEIVYTKDIKIFYAEDIGFSLSSVPVDDEIKISILQAVKYFRKHGLPVDRVDFPHIQESLQIALSLMFAVEDIPDLLIDQDDPKKRHNVLVELAKCPIGKSKFSLGGLFFQFLEANRHVLANDIEKYKKMGEDLRKNIMETLGSNGVFFFPSYPVPATRHYETFLEISGVQYSMIFNVLGFPSTHVPMGFDRNGLPIGFQIVATPYQDRLCFCLARELEAAFGGWKAPN